MKILYLTPADLDRPNAAALRNVGIAQSLAIAGHDVVLIGPRGESYEATTLDWLPTRDLTFRVGHPHAGILERTMSRVGLSHGRVSELIARYSPDAILTYQAFAPLLNRCIRSGRAARIPVVVDVTEWHDGDSLPLGRFGPQNLVTQLSMRHTLGRVAGAICVSEGLARHCASLGLRTIVVPPMFDLSGVETAADRPSGQPRLALTGSGITPGQKDHLALVSVAAAVRRLDPEGNLVDVVVAGPTHDQIRQVIGTPPRSFRLVGQLPWLKTLELVKGSHFTVVIRDGTVRRLSYGFPSKVSESLLLGTPILGNLFSDMHLYVQKRFNAMLLDDAVGTSVETGIERLLEDGWEWNNQQIELDAKRHFTPASHASDVGQFMEESC